MARAVGIDFGTKRVGVAVSDPLLMFSQPVGTFTQDAAVDAVQRLQDEHGVDTIVIGWPVSEEGAASKGTARVQEYVNRLKRRFPQATIVHWDERFSTQRAKEMLKQGTRPSLKKTGRERIDTAVAGLLLQEFLDEKAGTDVF